MYMIAVLVLEAWSPKNQMVRVVRYGGDSLRIADVCPMPTPTPGLVSTELHQPHLPRKCV